MAQSIIRVGSSASARRAAGIAQKKADGKSVQAGQMPAALPKRGLR